MDTPVALSRQELAKMLDHSILKPHLTRADAIAGVEIALKYDLAAVTVKPYLVPLAAQMVRGSDVRVDTTISFPHGCETTAAKAYQAAEAVKLGAHEVDMVLNIGALIDGEYDLVCDDIAAVVRAASTAIVKVILETAYLSDEQKIRGCRLAEEAGAHFVKTSTGFAPLGYTIEDIRLMRRSVTPRVQVKAAQGVRTYADALAVREAGATRIGTSESVRIMTEWESQNASERL